ncbi:MAG TPA: 30S ribosomal protein S17 [Actinomycetota bacterium]|nr:30S ribosomal protein S17 [Actinomycetota bacterium]HMC36743.1 30S ribosomal protein S17 [Actinomycetota bacterium]
MSAAPEGMAPEAKARAARKVRTGVVVSDAMNKTVMVRIAQVSRHRAYGKTLRRSSKLSAHDENNEAHVGDTVRVMETRPLSKTKRWRVVEVVERAK